MDNQNAPRAWLNEPDKWTIVKLADVGADEVYMSRFFALANHIDMATSWSEEKKKAVSDAFLLLLFEGLTSAFMHLTKATKLAGDPEIEILEVRGEFDSFYSKLWTAYRHRFMNLAVAMDYDIHFLFKPKETTFDDTGKDFFNRYDLPIGGLDYLRENRLAWQNKLAMIRNKVIEHPTIPFEQAQIIYSPYTARRYFDQCWGVIESFTATLMSLGLPDDMELVELSSPDDTTNQHLRFTHRIKQNVHTATVYDPPMST